MRKEPLQVAMETGLCVALKRLVGTTVWLEGCVCVCVCVCVCMCVFTYTYIYRCVTGDNETKLKR